MIDSNIIFYTNPWSRGQIARWMLEELALDYKTEVISYGEVMKGPEYRKINPLGKVPALVHNDRIVTECAAICAYLADAFFDRNLAPPLTERADYYRWLFFAAGPLEAVITNKNLGVEVPANKKGTVGFGSYDEVVETLAAAVSRSEYIAAPHFTAADVYVGSHIGWGIKFGTLPQRKEFEQYWQRLAERPAYRKAQKIDEDLGAQLKAAQS